MTKETRRTHARIVDDALYYMYRYLDTDITLDQLARQSSVSPHHFHRVFEEQMSETFYHVLRSIRLQKAANLLITNRHSTISEITRSCGYASHSAFIRAFKQRFKVTPTSWRNGHHREFSLQNINASPYRKEIDPSLIIQEPRIEKSQDITVGYLRHKGYNRSIKKTWSLIRAYCLENEMRLPKQIGIHHDNPSIVELDACSYVAAIEISVESVLAEKLSILKVPGSLCAIFHLEGEYGEVLGLIRTIYHIWLPSSGYETKTLPPYAVYHKNHFLRDDEKFVIDFYLPIQTI